MFRNQKNTVIQAARRVSSLKSSKPESRQVVSQPWMDDPSSFGQMGTPKNLEWDVFIEAFKV